MVLKVLYILFSRSRISLSVLIISVLTSCVVQREVEYVQDENRNIKAFKEADFPDYRLKSNDELYIQISSLDEAGANMFSTSSQQFLGIGTIQPFGASLVSYTVDRNGDLLLPVVGKIPVKDKTISEISSMLKDSLTHVLNQPNVKIKLVNRYVSVLGEVRSPGHIPYSQDKLSVYDALGLAGDITEYGNRKDVILLRNQNGENLRINLNLTKSEILASEYYNVRPNDLIYVKPLRKKFWGMRQFPYTIILSTVTTGLLILNFVNK